MNIAAKLTDGLQNLAARLGIPGADKAADDTYSFIEPTQQEIENAYRSTWFRKIVDAPAKDMTREWRDWQAESDQIETIEKTEKRLDIRRKVRRALVMGRLYGGSLLMLGVKGQDASLPLVPDSVGIDGLEFVHAMHRYQVAVNEIEDDPLSDNFGCPRFFEINQRSGNPIRVHHSRAIRFVGAELPEGIALSSVSGQGWGDSLWAVMREAVKHADLAAAGTASLVHEAKVDVIKVPQLMDNLSTEGYESRLLRRFGLAARAKSINNMLLLDSLEEYESKSITFAGLPDVLKAFLMVMCGLADIPATRLIGKSPDGQNATGESDLRNYYDSLSAEQETELRPTLAPLDEVLIRSALGSRPEEIYYDWSPLWQLTAAEKSKRDKEVAETAKTYADMGVIPNDAMARIAQNRIVEDQVFPGIEAALDESEASGEVAPITESLTPAEELAAEAKARAEATGGVAGRSGARSTNARVKARGADGAPITSWAVLDAIEDARPRTLYVRRDVLNGDEIVRWAKAQGFEATVPARDMHVTLINSSAPVDWMKIGEAWGADDKGRMTVKPGGPRVVEPLGDKGAIVLFFASSELTWRHEDMKRAGASFDFDSYQPHVTITYKGSTINLDAVKPYRGEIVLGPEIFEEIVDDWAGELIET